MWTVDCDSHYRPLTASTKPSLQHFHFAFSGRSLGILFFSLFQILGIKNQIKSISS
jgi:hypothetical protein